MNISIRLFLKQFLLGLIIVYSILIFPAAALARCGDGVVDAGERCDDGAFNGQPGGCNKSCSGFVKKTNFSPHPTTLVPSPLGVVGLLVREARYGPMSLSSGPNARDFDAVKKWLGGHDFVAGMRVRLATDTMFPRAVRIYDKGGPSASRDRILRFGMAQVEPVLGPVGAKAGDIVVVGIHAGVTSTCACGTGGSVRTDRCVEGGQGGMPPCGGPEMECVDFMTPDGLNIAVGEPGSIRGACTTNCSIAGQPALCTEPPPPDIPHYDPPGGYDDVSIGGTCTAKGGGVQVDRVCQSMVGAIATNCPGYCRSSDNCWALPGQLGDTPWVPETGGKCMFQINQDGTCFVRNLDDIEAAAAGTADDLRNTLERHFPADWAFCTSVGGRERCQQVNPSGGLLPGQQNNDPDDDARYVCTAQGGSDSCMLCADRAGSACFPTKRDDRHDIADTMEGIFRLNPTPDDTKDRGISMSEVLLRTNPVPHGTYNAKQLGNLVEDPVLLPTGEFVMSATDISFSSRGVPFEFTRSYRSGGAWHGAFGPGWVHSYEDLVVPVGYLYNRQGMPAYCAGRPMTVLCLLRYTPAGGAELYVYEPKFENLRPATGFLRHHPRAPRREARLFRLRVKRAGRRGALLRHEWCAFEHQGRQWLWRGAPVAPAQPGEHYGAGRMA